MGQPKYTSPIEQSFYEIDVEAELSELDTLLDDKPAIEFANPFLQKKQETSQKAEGLKTKTLDEERLRKQNESFYAIYNTNPNTQDNTIQDFSKEIETPPTTAKESEVADKSYWQTKETVEQTFSNQPSEATQIQQTTPTPSQDLSLEVLREIQKSNQYLALLTQNLGGSPSNMAETEKMSREISSNNFYLNALIQKIDKLSDAILLLAKNYPNKNNF